MSGIEDFFDITEEEIESAIADRVNGRKRDGRICSCGHSAGRHEDLGDGVINCRAVKYECPCVKFHAVLKSSNVKSFIRVTDGPGAQHALSKGISGAIKSGATIEWIETPKCQKCDFDGKVLPVSLNPVSLRVSQIGTRVNQMLCRDCIVELS